MLYDEFKQDAKTAAMNIIGYMGAAAKHISIMFALMLCGMVGIVTVIYLAVNYPWTAGTTIVVSLIGFLFYIEISTVKSIREQEDLQRSMENEQTY
jgi:hypothetical protein